MFVLITSTIRNIPSEVVLGLDDGMKNNCAINLDYIQTISKDKIGTLLTTVRSTKMEETRQALLFALGF